MRNSILVLAAIAGLTVSALPAAAESDDGACNSSAPAAQSGPIDLQAVPIQDPATHKAIQGGDDDACNVGKGDEAEDDD
jgi:hypothetical protein